MSTLLEHTRLWVNDQIALGKTSADLASNSCMVKGLAGLSAITVFTGGWAGALVANGTVGIVAFSHAPPAIGSTCIIGGNLFILMDVANIPETQIWFGKLDFVVPNVNPIKVLPPISTKYNTVMADLPVVWVVARSNRIQLMKTLDISDTVYTQPDATAGWNIGTQLIPGDSNSPAITVVNDEMVLLASAARAGAFSTSGDSIHDQHAAAEALWLSAWSITDTYTDVDLSGFDDADPDPEPPEPPSEEDSPLAKTTTFTDVGESGELNEAGNWNNGLPSRADGDTAIIDPALEACPLVGAVSAAILQFGEDATFSLSDVDFSNVARIDIGATSFFNRDGISPVNTATTMTFPLS